MKVRAEFYSRLREIVGAPAVQIELPAGARVLDLVRKLLSEYPRLRDFERSMLFGVGVEFVQLEYALRDGETIAIMPPVQGG
ncbi:MAG: MoaD/ThiS family protein [Verrucomicrobia bacterium]|nr:MoaD/ThiS family protein [Verrucomicrobiota bacterium]